jgi:hypothetical protein
MKQKKTLIVAVLALSLLAAGIAFNDTYDAEQNNIMMSASAEITAPEAQYIFRIANITYNNNDAVKVEGYQPSGLKTYDGVFTDTSLAFSDINNKVAADGHAAVELMFGSGADDAFDAGAHTITLTGDANYLFYGKLTGIGNIRLIMVNENVSIYIIDCEITSAATTVAIRNEGSGSVNVLGGKVSTATGDTISNHNAGSINISGGTVENTAGSGSNKIAIRSQAASAGTINISGGNVIGMNFYAVYNYSPNGAINISGGKISSGSSFAVLDSSANSTMNISGGTISATDRAAVYIGSASNVNISGGTISATTGHAVQSNSTGVITISGTAKLTSANTSPTGGTIHLNTATAVLRVLSGTIDNTADGKVIHDNIGSAVVEIAPPTVSAPSTKVTKTDGTQQISVNVTNELGTVTFQWEKDGTVISGANSRTYDVTETGTYVCKVKNIIGDYGSDEAEVMITVADAEDSGLPILLIAGVIAVIAIAGLASYWFVLRKK